jgi:ribosomal protein S18 acetylase RimI-like enzyme
MRLISFQPVHAAEVLRWITSLEEARQWGGPGIPWPLEVSLFSAWHADPEIQSYVLCEEDTLIGYGEVWVDSEEKEVELARLLVKPDRRGQGVGKELLNQLLEQAAPSGYPTAFLRVFPNNHIALACYQRAGFSLVSPAEQQQYNQGQPIEYVWLQHDFQRT